MMQFVIGAVIIALYFLIKIQEIDFNKEFNKSEETDWNEYYANY